MKSDGQSCILDVITYGVYKEDVEVEVEKFQKLSIPDYGFINDLGKPMLPAIRGLIEIPWGKKVKATTTRLQFSSLLGYKIYPAQRPSILDQKSASESEFQLDEAFYSSNVFYPNTLVSVSAPIRFRDHILMQVSICPVQFNPYSNRLDVSRRIRVKLDYVDSGSLQATKPNRPSSRAFDEVCESSIWNYNAKTKDLVEEPLGYLIISHDMFYEAMDRFAEYKTAKGLKVTSVKLSDIATNATDLDVFNYICNAYYNWTLSPTYVLLVGDVEYMPTNYAKIVWSSWDRVATDHYYACVDGDDFFPDLFVGRLSVKNVFELNNILDKLIGYEGFFTKKATLISGSGMDEFMSEQIYDLLTAEGYMADRLYASSYSTSRNLIKNAVNEGRSIINYMGHGEMTSWLTSGFCTSDVFGLSNEGKYPIVLSHACLTGSYYLEYDCLGEAWMKAEKKGAVAFWGSSGIASGPLGCSLSTGFFRAIFNDNLYEFGPITTKAKFYMYNYFYGYFTYPYNNTDTYVPDHFKMFNVLTDPQLVTVKTEKPSLRVKADGSVDPPMPLISSVDNTTYTFNDDINGSMLIERDNIVVDGNGYTLQGSGKGNGLLLYKANNVTIKNLEIKGFSKGLFAESTSHNTISGNDFADNYFGISLMGSSNNTISESSFADNCFGISLMDSSNNTIFRNDMTRNKYGISITHSWWAFAVDYMQTCNKLFENNMTNNERAIHLEKVSSNIVSTNIITNNFIGVCFSDSRNNTISGNTLTGNDIGIELNNRSKSNLISGNIIYGNKNSGIRLENSQNTMISENIISTNTNHGIDIYSIITYLNPYAFSCNLNVVSGNSITSNGCGIRLDSTWWNSITNNSIVENGCGITLPKESQFNHIFCNNFWKNTQHFSIGGWCTGNLWDDGFEGNYWGNYSGVDSNNDGIGEAPHVLNADNTDNHPLVGMFHSFNTSLGSAVKIVSNSTIEDFQYCESDRSIRIRVSNMTTNQMYGFCRFCIPHTLMNTSGILVVIDDGLTPILHHNYTLYDNGTHRWIYFAYEHSTHKIVVVPEFPLFLILPIFMMTILLAMCVRIWMASKSSLEGRNIATKQNEPK